MVFKDENKAKEIIVEIFNSDYVNIIEGKGIVYDNGIIYDKNFSHITNNSEFNLIEQKLKTIINTVNNNPDLVYMDIETELWLIS